MNSGRLDQLLKFFEETPDDPFILYALALEYMKTNPEKSEQFFRQLLENHPDYLPAYYQAAAFEEQKGQKTEALRLYALGMELAKKQNDSATLKELQAAHDLLTDD